MELTLENIKAFEEHALITVPMLHKSKLIKSLAGTEDDFIRWRMGNFTYHYEVPALTKKYPVHVEDLTVRLVADCWALLCHVYSFEDDELINKARAKFWKTNAAGFAKHRIYDRIHLKLGGATRTRKTSKGFQSIWTDCRGKKLICGGPIRARHRDAISAFENKLFNIAKNTMSFWYDLPD